jgi:DNA-directed RNA polymerase specialized sigma subunit
MNEKEDSIRLMLAYLCIANEAEASLVRKVEVLDRFGLQDSEIAKVCGASSSQVIRNARQILKKVSHGKKKKQH